jgi:hypothetical protein
LLKLCYIKNNRKYIIDEDLPDIGFNLYVFENDKCISDYIQNTLEIVKNFAYEKYSIPKDAWHEIDSDTELF